MDYIERTYRDFTPRGRFVPFQVSHKETDLYIKAKLDLSKEATHALLHYRAQVEEYIRKHPSFTTSLTPLKADPKAPRIVQDMIEASQVVGVGPMAAVAGAIAEHVARDLLQLSSELIIENGGDLFLAVEQPVVIGLFAGHSSYFNRVGIKLQPGAAPCSFCTSSGTVGPSLSFGNADAATVWSESASLADAAATAMGNRVQRADDIEAALEWARQVPGIRGALIALGTQIGVWGPMELVRLEE